MVLSFTRSFFSSFVKEPKGYSRDKVNEYLHDVDTAIMEKVQQLIKELAEKENINEKLKQDNQMLWVSKMNNIKNIAEEIILKEYIYV